MANITRHFQRKNSLGTSADSTWDIYQLSYSDEARKSQKSCYSVFVSQFKDSINPSQNTIR